MVRFHLSPSEVRHATLVGVARDRAALAQGRTPRLAASATFYANIVGALAELVVAKAEGVYWDPNVGGSDRDGDVLGFWHGWHVRASAPWSRRERLPIRDSDPTDAVFVFVTGSPPDLDLRGWIVAGEAPLLGERCEDPPPCWFVEPDRLHPWEERPI